MGFEQFEKKGARPGEDSDETPVISIRKGGAIGLNRTAVALFFDEYTWVHFYYDDGDNRVGIKPREEEDENTYRITKRDGTATIKARRFLSEYDLMPEVTTRYEAHWHDSEELVYIDLDNPIETVERNRSSSSE
jgi:hypothetical protein